MNWINNINRFIKGKPKAFFIDEGHGENDDKVIESMNISVDKFFDIKQLLYKLQCTTSKKYKIGIIHENGSKYSPQILSNFIKDIDPEIKLIIYKDCSELQNQKLLLT